MLDYENAQIAHLNERALNGLVKETKEENSKMRILTVSNKTPGLHLLIFCVGEKYSRCSSRKDLNSHYSNLSPCDSRSRKSLPSHALVMNIEHGILQNFFSSQLIRVDDNGGISVVSGSWWFAVISVPLTIVTFVAWKSWMIHATRLEERKQTIGKDDSNHSQQHWTSNYEMA